MTGEDDDMRPGELVRWLKRIDAVLKELSEKLEDLPADRLRLFQLEKRLDSLVNRTWMVVFAVAGLAVAVASMFLKS